MSNIIKRYFCSVHKEHYYSFKNWPENLKKDKLIHHHLHLGWYQIAKDYQFEFSLTFSDNITQVPYMITNMKVVPTSRKLSAKYTIEIKQDIKLLTL